MQTWKLLRALPALRRAAAAQLGGGTPKRPAACRGRLTPGPSSRPRRRPRAPARHPAGTGVRPGGGRGQGVHTAAKTGHAA